MSRLNQLQGKSKIYNIGGIDLEIKPLSLADMELLIINDDASQKEQMEMSIRLIDKTLKESVPDSTEEERKNIGIQYMTELMNAITEINGLKDDRKGKIIDAIKTRQNQPVK